MTMMAKPTLAGTINFRRVGTIENKALEFSTVEGECSVKEDMK
jgi:hypothetical protein